MKTKNIFAIGVVIVILLVAVLALSYSNGVLFQGALRNMSGISRTTTSTQEASTSSSPEINYLVVPEEETTPECLGNTQAGTIVLTSDSTPAEFSAFVSELNQEIDSNNGYTDCHYRMYVTKGNTIGDHTNQDRVRVSCRSNIDAENNEIRCTRYDQNTPNDTNYFQIRVLPDEAIVTTHSTYYSESINRVEHYDTYWIENSEK